MDSLEFQTPTTGSRKLLSTFTPMHLKFKDKTAEIVHLHQWFTYEGLLEGLPTDKMNDRILQGIRQRAIALTQIENCYVIEPKQTPITYEGKYPFGNPMSLPSLVCIIGLKYQGTSKPDVGGHSELTLVCFQDSFGPPFEMEILIQVERLIWFSYAKDVTWDDY